MVTFFKNHKNLAIILTVAVVFRLIFFLALLVNYGPGSFYLDNEGIGLDGNDTQHYVILANNLSKHGVYSRFIDEPFQSDSLRTPLLPLFFLPFIYFMGFGGIWLAMLVLIIILSAIPVVVYYLAKLFLSKRQSFWVGLLVAVEPLMAYFSNIAEPDILMILLFLLALHQFCLYYLNGNYNNLFWSAGLLGLMTLFKPVGIYLAVIFFIFILIEVFIKKIAVKKAVVKLIVFVFIFLAIIFPWLGRNYIVFGVWELSSIGAYNLYSYYTVGFELADEIVPETFDVREPERNIKYSNQYTTLAFKRILANPQDYFLVHSVGVLRSLLASDFQEIYHKGHGNILPLAYNPSRSVDLTATLMSGDFSLTVKSIITNWPLLFRYILLILFYLIILGGWFKSYKRNQTVFILFSLFLALSGYFLFIPGPYVSPKYRLPAIPLFLIIFFYYFNKPSQVIRRNKRKLIVASGTYPPEISGQATFVANFKIFLPDDFQVGVITYGDADFIDESILIIKRNFWRYFNYWRWLRCQAKEAEIIYAQDLVSSGLPAALAKRKHNRLYVRVGGDFLWEKMVNNRRQSVPLSRYYSQSKNTTEKFYLLVYRFVLSRCDKIIFNTAWQRDLYIKFFSLTESKTAVIPNPLPTPELNSIPGEEIIFAGRFILLKNIQRLIEAFKQIKTKKKLVIIGEGPLKAELVKLTKDDCRIIIKDKMSQEDLRQRVAGSYFFVLPSLSELNPNAALEALALGKPVILTQETGLPAELKKFFISVDPLSVESIKSGLEYLLNETNYKIQLEKIKRSLPKHDWSMVIKQHLDLFNEINVVNIGTDKSLVGGQRLGDAVTRHRKYGEFINHLDIIVYTNKKEGLVEYKIADHVIGHPTNSYFKLMFFFDAVKIFKKINQDHAIDLVQCQDPFAGGLVGWWLKRKYGVKLQINFHGDFWDNPHWLRERKINWLWLLISKFTAPRADGIRVMSRGQKEKLTRVGIQENKIRVIATPVNLENFLKGSAVRELNQGQKIILHVGRDDEVKDYYTLIRAFKIIKTKMPAVIFWQAGADKKIKAAMAANHFNEIELKGLVPAAALPELYQASEVLVSSSTSESFGKVLIEANASAKPVVATATTGAREIIKDGKNGFLVPIGEAEKLANRIIWLLEHPEEAREMGAWGRKIIQEKYSDNTLKIIKLWRDLKTNFI